MIATTIGVCVCGVCVCVWCGVCGVVCVVWCVWCGKTDYTAKLKVFRVKVLSVANRKGIYISNVKPLLKFKILIASITSPEYIYVYHAYERIVILVIQR